MQRIVMPDHVPAPERSAADHPLRRLLQYTEPYRRRIWVASVFSVLNKIFDLAPPALIGAAVDVVVQQENSFLADLGVVDVWHQLLLLSGITFIVWALESVFQYAYALLWRNLAQTVQHDMRVEAYSHLQGLELAYFEERSTGGMMSVLSDDINQLERFLDIGANELLQLATTVIVIGGAFIVLAPSVSWMAILPMPVVIWGSIRFQKLLAPYYTRVRERVGDLNARLVNNLGGITTIKAFTAESFEIEQVARESAEYRESNRAAIRVSSAFVPLIRMVILVGFTATLLYGGMEAVNGNLSVGTYSVLVFLTQRLLWPLTRLGETLDQYQRAMASTTRVMNLLDTPFEIHPGTRSLPSDSVAGAVEIEHVTFAYATGAPVLRDVTLSVPAGWTVGIVGSTGSGKSTLVKLLLRLYEVERGMIRLDGTPLQALKLDDLRRAIGLVSQDVFLFHGTVRENIIYGSWGATSEEVERAATLAEAHDFILALPKGYDTIVGERGQKLSGGQRQRIAIARAILKDPPVLVLDEATSAVDNETEAAIQRSLERISRNRTTIAIAHRLSTVRSADRIYVLEGGAVVEQGTHDELIVPDGVYAALWRVQTGAEVASAG
ncbi:MAG TPA: ABC transporter ATP-binding protein [Longimicrobiaceae bacterium]|nr:ABC transporter ATP-binding protein [Longimicrobiaceae bacterium]